MPAGVVLEDARTILGPDKFLEFSGTDSQALFADLFRIHMLKARAGLIWVDPDVYCLRPMQYDSNVVMGFETPDAQRVHCAVLGLPQDHPMLDAMIAVMADPFAIPPFLPPKQRAECEAARAAGAPFHVRQQRWGTWGALMLTHFATAHRVLPQVQPADAFCPIPVSDRKAFLKPARKVEVRLTPATTALQLWAANKREIALRHTGLPPESSFLADLVARHGIGAADALVRMSEGPLPDDVRIDALGLAQVNRFARHYWACTIAGAGSA